VGPGSDSIVVPIPSRAWALCAIEDLRREGMSAELVGQNARSSWLVRIEGPAGSIAEIRFSLQPRAEPVCWEAFVNGIFCRHIDGTRKLGNSNQLPHERA
jgi:hypothetical protein